MWLEPAISGSASKDSLGAIHISLTNMDAQVGQEITIDLKGFKYGNITGRILTSGKLQNYNSFEDLV